MTGLCGIPTGASALSVNFTVVAAGGIPAGSFLLAWPTGQPAPPTAIMTYGPGQIISNAAIVPLGPGDQLNVSVSGSTHVIMDVNGYFTGVYNAGNQFVAAATIAGEAAILGGNFSSAAGSHGVGGFAGGAGVVHGVQGQAGSADLGEPSRQHPGRAPPPRCPPRTPPPDPSPSKHPSSGPGPPFRGRGGEKFE